MPAHHRPYFKDLALVVTTVVALQAGCTVTDPGYLSAGDARIRASASGGAGGVAHDPARPTGASGAGGATAGTSADAGKATAGSNTGSAATSAGGGDDIVPTAGGSMPAAGGADSAPGGADSAPGGAQGAGVGGATSRGGAAAAGGPEPDAAGAPAATSGTAGVEASRVVGTASRPQLSDLAAQDYTIQKYLARGGKLGALVQDDWDPTQGLGDTSLFTPDFTVAADGSGTHTSVQAAVDDAELTDGTSRVTIALEPGTYRELVCVAGSVPITLYGTGADASDVTIVFDNYARKPSSTRYNHCALLPTTESVYGIPASATFGANSSELELKNLTIANDFDESWTPKETEFQAVALLTQGDRIVLEGVRLLGNHYTTLFTSPDPSTVSRVYIKDSMIAGDMQYITGRATVVMDHSEVHFLPARLGGAMGSIIASSTAAQNEYGFLIIDSTFTTEPSDYAGWVLIGRAWDEDTATYVSGVSPNGQAVIRNCVIDSHIKKYNPWGNALITVRLFDANENRLYEYANTGPGAAR